jgi:hypothetical protein
MRKLKIMMTGNLENDKENIIKETFEGNMKRAFGISLVSELNKLQSILGTFLERGKRVKYSTFKTEYHMLALQQHASMK